MIRPSNIGIGVNPDSEISPASDNYISEDNNGCATEIEDTEDDSTYTSSPLGM